MAHRTYRITSSGTSLQKLFGNETPNGLSASDIISHLEKLNGKGLFWKFWDVLKTPVVDTESLEPVAEELYTYWWDDPSVGTGSDMTCPRREVYSLEDIKELQEDYGNDWEKHLDTIEVLEPFTQPLEVTDVRMFEYLDYVNDKTGLDLQVTLSIPPLTEQQKAVVKELAEGGRIMIRTDVGEEPEDIFDYVSGIHRNFGEKITHSIVYSPEIQSDDPEYWGNVSEILGLKNDVEFAWTFEKDVEGNAEEASAAEKITYSTWCEEKLLDFLGLGNEWEPDLNTGEGYDYPKFMDITKKNVGE